MNSHRNSNNNNNHRDKKSTDNTRKYDYYSNPSHGGDGNDSRVNSSSHQREKRLRLSNDDDNETSSSSAVVKETQKPNFGLSGKLSKDENHEGNVYKGVVLKFKEPPEARAPNACWRLYIFKNNDHTETLRIQIYAISLYCIHRVPRNMQYYNIALCQLIIAVVV